MPLLLLLQRTVKAPQRKAPLAQPAVAHELIRERRRAYHTRRGLHVLEVDVPTLHRGVRRVKAGADKKLLQPVNKTRCQSNCPYVR